MRQIKIAVTFVVCIMLSSCFTKQTHHQMYISNLSDSCIKISIQGENIGSIEKILLPDGVTIDDNDDFFCFYRESLEEYPVQVFSQEEFDSKIDSFKVFIRHDEEWIERSLPSFWDLDNWSISLMEEYALTYFYYISDSLLNY